MESYDLYINGKWTKADSKDFIEVENPNNKEIIGRVARSNENDVNKAVQGAKEAFDSWSKTHVKKRIDYAEKMLEYLENNREDIAKVIHKELGCTLDFANKRHIGPYLTGIREFIELTRNYEFIEKHEGYEVHKEPVGVIACLTPWNYPLGQITKKLFPAILMGNTLVLKPSKGTPLTAYALAKAAEYANLPGGVFQLVTGKGSEVGNVLASHKDIDMISFTGSTSGGKEVAKLALDSVKKVALELGGKSAAVILEGADLVEAARGVLDTVYLNTGQTCSAKTRLIAPRSVREELEKILVEVSKEYKFGDSEDSSNDVGPLQSEKQFEKVSSYVEIGKEEETLLYQGEDIEGDGYFFPPTIFTDVNPNGKIGQEEIFGPVLAVIYYDSLDEAEEIANNSIYGLSGMVFGKEDQAYEFAKRLRTGQVQINNSPADQVGPFGGYKQSGIGRENGIYGLEEYVEIKCVYLQD